MKLVRVAGRVGVALLLLCSAVVAAQPAEPAPSEGAPSEGAPPVASAEEPAAEARRLGRALLDAGSADRAAQVYLEAYEVSGDASLLRDLAEARLAAGDGPAAIEALERLLGEAPESPDAEPARQRIASIRALPAVLELGSTPEGAEVRVDGQVVGTTPLRAEVAPGEHAVELALEGHVTARETVVVPFATRRAVHLALEAAPAPEPEPAETPEVEPAAEPSIERDSSATPAIWATASIAAAALLTGTIFGFKALSEESDFVIAPTDAGADRGERYALVADLSFGVAAASALTAFVLWVTGDEDDADGAAAANGRPSANLRLTGAPAGTGLGARVEF